MNALEFPTIEWGDADALVDAIEENRAPLDTNLFSSIHAPQVELLCTVMTARASALGVANGRDFYHHEGRAALPTPEHLVPEIGVGDHGCDPRWDFGVLAAPKYFSFFQDAPFAAYHPNHRTKWRAHELLHGAAPFFWRSDMSRFESYVGSRLNELLPVVHWYHWDEIDRQRCPDHRSHIPKQWCVHCETVTPYWEPRTMPRAEAVRRAEAGFDHFAQEMRACRLEIETGRMVETFLGLGLNSATDAAGYMRAHWNRVTDRSFGMWVELFLTSRVDYVRSVSTYADRIDTLARQFTSGTIEMSPDEIAVRRARRRTQDLGYRVLWWIESQPNPEVLEEQLTPALERLASAMTDDGCEAFLQEVGDVLGPRLFQLGWTTHDLAQIRDGLLSVSNELEPTNLDAFSTSEVFWRRGTLPERYDAFLALDGDDSWRVPAAVCALPRIDLEGERFGAVPDSVSQLERGRMRLNETVRRIDDVSIGYHFYGTFRVVGWDASVARVLDAVESEMIDLETLDVPMLMELIETGCILWFPEIRNPPLTVPVMLSDTEE